MKVCLALGLLLSVSLPSQASGQHYDQLVLVDGEHLPLASLNPMLDALEFRRHSSTAVALAYYQPVAMALRQLADPSAEPSRPQLWLRLGLEASSPSGGERGPLVVTDGKRSVLSLLEATPDVVEPLTYSLLLARLHFRFENEVPFGLVVRRRAGEAFGAPAADTQGSAGNSPSADDLAAQYMMASASFGAHLLTLANDIERAQKRREAQGRPGLCEQLRGDAGLFGLWSKAFEAEAFPVVTFAADGSERIRQVAKVDRNWVLETLLSSSGWTGHTNDDHAGYCGDRSDGP